MDWFSTDLSWFQEIFQQSRQTQHQIVILLLNTRGCHRLTFGLIFKCLILKIGYWIHHNAKMLEKHMTRGMMQTDYFSTVLYIINAFLHKHSTLLAAQNEIFIFFLCFVIILWYGVLRSNIHENDLKVFKSRNSSKGSGGRYRTPQNIEGEHQTQ